ncbi:MAG: excinuclease ABC subunit UvrA, partial [Myxococcota bacterium]
MPLRAKTAKRKTPRAARRGSRSAKRAQEIDHIEICGASEHNLKSIDLDIPKKKLVVMTGVSGSGKSSLAFDTLYAEGQRRYVESLSAYARQFLGQMEKPRYDTIRGLSPTISIEQKTTGNNPRSTVGTITEISDYFRVLWARTGKQHCHQCGDRVESQTAEQIAKTLARFDSGTKLILLAPLLVNRKGEHRELLVEARRAGWTRLRVDGKILLSEDLEALDKRKKHHVEAVIDRIVLKSNIKSRLTESVETALRIGNGLLIAAVGGRVDQTFSENAACARCQISFPELTPQAFSFNSPQGMCSDCNGLGNRFEIDPDLVVPDDSLTIDEGALKPWGEKVSTKEGWGSGFRKQILAQLKISLDKPWRRLSEKHHKQVLYGTEDQRFRVKWKGKNGGGGQFDTKWEGLIPRLMRRFKETKSEGMKRWYAKYMANTACTACNGNRLRPESAAVRVANRSLVEISAMTVREALIFFDNIPLKGADRIIAAEILKEIRSRLDFLAAVGLGYLSLDRAGPSLSGGESQRIRLASQVGSDLTGVIYILDEPSIGLHTRDNARLLSSLLRLRDNGNSVVVVEHDEATIRAADHVIDMGPGAGIHGGKVVAEGRPEELAENPRSPTGAWLAGRETIAMPPRNSSGKSPGGTIRLLGCRAHNLKAVDFELPLGAFTVVTGVSGSGKSTLVSDTLHRALAARLHGALEVP